MGVGGTTVTVGTGVGVGVGVGVAVGTGVGVGAVGTGVGVGVGVGVAVGTGVGVGVAVGTGLDVGAVGTGVRVGPAVGTGLDVGVAVKGGVDAGAVEGGVDAGSEGLSTTVKMAANVVEARRSSRRAASPTTHFSMPSWPHQPRILRSLPGSSGSSDLAIPSTRLQWNTTLVVAHHSSRVRVATRPTPAGRRPATR